MKKTPLKRVSLKRSRSNRAYSCLRRTYLEQHPKCFRCKAEATDIHHIMGRSGPFLLDTNFWAGLCRKCHTYVHNNPKLARAEGLLPPRAQDF